MPKLASAYRTSNVASMSKADVDTHQAASYVRREAVSYADLARAQHDLDCARCRTLTEEFDARAAAYGDSIRRRDRQQLGLQLAATKATR